jgi:hypothetical protein
LAAGAVLAANGRILSFTPSLQKLCGFKFDGNLAALYRKIADRKAFSTGSRGKCILLSQICRMVGLGEQARFAALLKNLVSCFFYDRRKVCANAVSNAESQFQSWVAQPPLNQAQHGFGDARILRDGIIGKSSALALLAQESNNFLANGFVVANSGHAEVWQKKRFDIYFAIVKYPARWGVGRIMRNNLKVLIVEDDTPLALNG